MKLIYRENSGYISLSYGHWHITEKPDLGFAYDGITYDDFNEVYLKYIGLGSSQLDYGEKEIIKSYLENVAEPPPVVKTPEELKLEKRALLAPISARQARKVLSIYGLRQQAEDAVNASSLDVQDSWHYASEYRRNDETLLMMAQALGITDDQLDSMFELAVTL